jgi:hypothetical protein
VPVASRERGAAIAAIGWRLPDRRGDSDRSGYQSRLRRRSSSGHFSLDRSFRSFLVRRRLLAGCECPRSWPRTGCSPPTATCSGLAVAASSPGFAQHTLTGGGPLRASYERIAKRRGKQVAKVAVADKILTLCHHGLPDGEIGRLAPRVRARGSEHWRSPSDPPRKRRRRRTVGEADPLGELASCQWPLPPSRRLTAARLIEPSRLRTTLGPPRAAE